MDVKVKLTVFFEEPFWVGVYERQCGVLLEVAKVTFGAEPKDYEVYDTFLKNWFSLRFSPPVTGKVGMEQKLNPKRMQRAIHAQLLQSGVGTKAQQALKLQHEETVAQQKATSRTRAEEAMQLKFEQCQQKKKEKHKGR
jgi:hypothetical protein